MSFLKHEHLYKEIPQLTHDELVTLVILSTEINDLMRQTVLIKCALKKEGKDVTQLKKIIDRALNYQRPKHDPDWGKYNCYLDEIKDSILSLKKELSIAEIKELLTYLAESASQDDLIGEFDEDGEWGHAIEEIYKLLATLEN